MIIEIIALRHGYKVKAKNSKITQKIEKYFKDENIKEKPYLFFQNLEELIFSIDLKKNQIKDLENGYDLSVRIDTWEFLTILGHDCNRLNIF